MRHIFMVALLCLGGCSTVQISDYINANNAYTRKVYGDVDKVKDAVKAVLAQEGFKVEREAASDVYERASDEAQALKGVLLLTDIKQYSRVLYSTYVHLNVHLRPLADGVEVDLRVSRTRTVLFKQFKGTRHDAFATRFLDRVEAQLNQ